MLPVRSLERNRQEMWDKLPKFVVYFASSGGKAWVSDLFQVLGYENTIEVINRLEGAGYAKTRFATHPNGQSEKRVELTREAYALLPILGDDVDTKPDMSKLVK